MRSVARVLAALVPVLLVTCLGQDEYACSEDVQCRRVDQLGRCAAIGWCAYEDEACESGWRFSDNAGDGAAGVCVTPGHDSEGWSAGLTDTAEPGSSGSSGFDPCADGCDTPPGPCFADLGECDAASDRCVYPPRAAGDACNVTDPCAPGGVCDGQGSCIADPAGECADPPSPCHAAKGVCDPIAGGCVYEALAEGDPCDDGDACTQGETCDAAGACGGAEVCPSADPCQVGACEDGACVFAPMPDATPCGPDPADRCCAGACVDISSDPLHCGGCGTACGSTKTCQSVAVTQECSPAPADTSGRCTCDATSDCPGGQVCRTQTPAANLCAPEGDRDCVGAFVDVQLCPNYCTY